MRILLVSPLPPPRGGMATWTSIVLSELQKNPDAQVRVIDTAVRWRAVSDLRRGLRFLGGTIQAFRDVLKVVVELVRWKPSAIHVCTSAGDASLKDLVLAKIARLFRVPIALHYHTSRLPQDSVLGARPWRQAKHAVMNANAAIVIEPESEKLLRSECPQANIVRLPNPIDLTELNEIRPSHSNPLFTIAFSGAAVRQKGIDLAVEACLCLSGTVLKVIGRVDDQTRASYEHAASGRDGGKWLQFLGEVSRERVLEELAGSDLIILPSRKVYEAFPYAVLEAMALGKPVLASKVGAIAEMLDIGTSNPCGICLTPGDLSQLKDALSRLKDDSEALQRMGESGRNKVESYYAADVVVADLVRLWQSMADSRN